MNNLFLKILFVFYVALNSFLVNGQQVPGDSNEYVSLLTDRTLYVSGEKINFTLFLHAKNSNQTINSSKIAYIELLSADQKKIFAGKYLIENSKASACVKIPETSVSGIYFLRAYTKYMRNFSPEDYSYVMLKIVNPFNNEMLENNLLMTDLDSLDTRRSGHDKFDSTAIVLNKKKFKIRENVELSIDTNLINQNDFELLTISVVDKVALKETKYLFNKKPDQFSEVNFYTETKSLTLSGTLLNANTNEKLNNKRVNLSLIGDYKDFRSVYTDSDGRFNFSLPNLFGSQDIFLNAEQISNINPTILVDNDYCTNPVKFSNVNFELSDHEEKTIYNFAVNTQINAQYYPDTLLLDSTKIYSEYFYSEPTEILLLDNYIQLPTLEECFVELPSLVKIRKRKGVKYFKITGTQSEMDIYNPLVLIDRIAIQNVDDILAVSPKGIDRIEIINVPYIKGDMIYGGIISIISKKGDFAGIDLPSSGMFINYDFLNFKSNCSVQESEQFIEPDVRNTLYWDPDLNFKSQETFRIKFKTTDTPGDYKVVLRAINNDGNIYTFVNSFIVEDN